MKTTEGFLTGVIAIDNPQFLTLICDASFQEETGAAGWGAWAKISTWPRGYFFGGPFQSQMPTVQMAELCGLANAAYILSKEGRLEGVTRIMMQCDNMHALQMVKYFVKGTITASARDANVHNLKPRTARLAYTGLAVTALDKINHIAEKHGLVFSLRHVKGHHRSKQGPYWVNEQCDHIAAEALAQHPHYVETAARAKKLRRIRR
jgi:ribonuclease HI